MSWHNFIILFTLLFQLVGGLITSTAYNRLPIRWALLSIALQTVLFSLIGVWH